MNFWCIWQTGYQSQYITAGKYYKYVHKGQKVTDISGMEQIRSKGNRKQIQGKNITQIIKYRRNLDQNSCLARHQRICPKDVFLHFNYFFCYCDSCSLDFVSVGLINIMRCAMLRAMQWFIHVKQIIKTTRMISADQRKIWLKLLIRDQQIGLNQNLHQQ